MFLLLLLLAMVSWNASYSYSSPTSTHAHGHSKNAQTDCLSYKQRFTFTFINNLIISTSYILQLFIDLIAFILSKKSKQRPCISLRLINDFLKIKKKYIATSTVYKQYNLHLSADFLKTSICLDMKRALLPLTLLSFLLCIYAVFDSTKGKGRRETEKVNKWEREKDREWKREVKVFLPLQ